MTYEPDIDAEVFVERTKPYNHTELPAVNVSLDAGSYSNKDQRGGSTGTYNFNVDVYTCSKTTDDETGDVLSAIKCQRLMGLCRAIIEDPQYKTLGFVAPFIMSVFVSEIKLAQPEKDDAMNAMMGRVVVQVMVKEAPVLIVPPLIAGYDTTIKIDNTSEGYFIQGENY